MSDKIQFKGLTQEQSDEVVEKAAFGFGLTFWCAIAVGILGSFLLTPLWGLGMGVYVFLQEASKTATDMNEDIKHQQILNK